MTARELLDDLTRRGIELRIEGDRLRFRPRAAMTPDLLEQLRVHKAALLPLLNAAGNGHPTRPPDGPHEPSGEGTAPEPPGQPCPRCGGLAVWFDVAGGRRCQTCEAAGLERGLALAARAAQLRAEKPAPQDCACGPVGPAADAQALRPARPPAGPTGASTT